MQKIRLIIRGIGRMKKVMGIMAAFCIFVVIVHILDYVNVAEDAWYRILWHHFYEDEGKIDNLYLGSSHVYCDIDPRILDELTGKYNFNLSSPLQFPNGSFYLLREADRKNELSHVYFELYYMCSAFDNFKSSEFMDTDYARNWNNTDYMRISANRAAYMLSIAGPDKYIDICLPFSRFRGQLGNWDYAKQTMAEKEDENYLAYRYHSELWDGNGYDAYLGQGFHESTRELKEQAKLCLQERILDKHPMGERSKRYYRKIIEYCQDRDIPITLFVSPVDELQLISTVDYDNYVEEARELAAEYGVLFYDFNLAKEEYLPIQHGEYFRDIGHLNINGAAMYTPFFYQVVSGEASGNAKYFYDSYAEKMSRQEPAIYGLYYRPPEEGAAEQNRSVWIASKRDTGMEYRIILTPGEGEQYMVQDFCANKEFTVPVEEHGICTIVARMEAVPDKVQTMEINY